MRMACAGYQCCCTIVFFFKYPFSFKSHNILRPVKFRCRKTVSCINGVTPVMVVLVFASAVGFDRMAGMSTDIMKCMP